jgi:hypothetical protein
MKRLVLSAVVFAVLALTAASVADAAGKLSGTYRTTIGAKPLGGQLKGTWTVKFSHGKYKVTFQGATAARGTFSQSGSTITMTKETGPAACSGTGKYTFKRKGKSLTFSRVRSGTACAGRDAVLSATFTKVS